MKSCAYLQSWYQRIFSKVSFVIKPTRAWDYETNKHAGTIQRQADVYVFCLLKHQDKTTVNPLDMNQWSFYVVSTTALSSGKSITLTALEKLTTAITYAEIYSAIKENNN